jgi:hypothetical protein
MHMQWIRTAGTAVAVVVSAFAIGRGVQSQSKLVNPGISSVTPAAPARSASAQVLTITGTSFSAGLSLDVVGPDGRKQTYAGPAIQTRRETSFQAAVLLATPGNYTLTVTNPDGATSEPFIVKGQPATAAPTIDGVLPAQVTKDPDPQVLTVSGGRFVDGLAASVTDPAGTVFLLKGPAIGAVSASSFTLSMAFEMVGDYSLLVTNPSGDSSNTVTVKVTQRNTRGGL